MILLARQLVSCMIVAAMALLVCVHPFVAQSATGQGAGHELRSAVLISHFIVERHTKSYEDFSPKGLSLPSPDELHAAFDLYVAAGCTADGFIPPQRYLLYTLTTTSFL